MLEMLPCKFLAEELRRNWFRFHKLCKFLHSGCDKTRVMSKFGNGILFYRHRDKDVILAQGPSPKREMGERRELLNIHLSTAPVVKGRMFHGFNAGSRQDSARNLGHRDDYKSIGAGKLST